MSCFTHFLRLYFCEQSCYKAILDFMQLCGGGGGVCGGDGRVLVVT